MLYLGIFLLTLFLVVLIIPINTKVNFKTLNRDANFEMRISIFNFKIYDKQIDYSTINKKQSKKDKKLKRTAIEQFKFIFKQSEEIIKKKHIRTYLYAFDRAKPWLKMSFKHTSKNLKLKQVYLEIEQGTGDAALTAVLHGAVWSILGSMNSILSNTFNVEWKKINTIANFSNKLLKIEFNCIFCIRIANIIYVAITLLIGFLKGRSFLKKTLTGGEKVERTSNSRTNENCHGEY